MPFGPFDPPLEQDSIGMRGAPMAPAVPNFGAPPMGAPAAPPAPHVPTFNAMPPMPTPGASPKAPSFLSAIMPVAASALAGRGNPQAMAAGLAGFLKGQDLKRQEMESQQDREQRKQLERAKFYQSVIQGAQSYDDEIALQNDLAALKPLADFYGVPLEGIRISDTKKADKERKLMSAAVDAAVKAHGAEILNQDNYTLQLADGRRVTMAAARQATGGGLQDASGNAVPVSTPFKADNPNELKIRAYAQSIGKKPETLTADEIQTALDAGKPTKPENAPNVGSFEDYVTRKFGANPTPAQITQARKEYNQSDDRPITVNTGKVDSRAEAKARSFGTEASVKNTQIMAEAANFVQGLDPNTTNPTDDQALVYAFAKVMDPGSVVREGEYATVQRYAQSWIAAYGKSIEQAIKGTGFLSPEARKNLKATVMSRFAASRQQYDNLRKSYADQISRITGAGDGEAYLVDYGGAFPDAPAAPARPTTRDTRPAARTPAAPSRIKSITPVS